MAVRVRSPSRLRAKPKHCRHRIRRLTCRSGRRCAAEDISGHRAHHPLQFRRAVAHPDRPRLVRRRQCRRRGLTEETAFASGAGALVNLGDETLILNRLADRTSGFPRPADPVLQPGADRSARLCRRHQPQAGRPGRRVSARGRPGRRRTGHQADGCRRTRAQCRGAAADHYLAGQAGAAAVGQPPEGTAQCRGPGAWLCRVPGQCP